MKKNEISLLLKKGISSTIFQELQFVQVGEKIKFTATRRKSGVSVIKYIDAYNRPRIRIGMAQTCMYLGAYSSLQTLTNNGAQEISFAFLPTTKERLRELSQHIRFSYTLNRLDYSYESLVAAIETDVSKEIAASILKFRPAFYFDQTETLRSPFIDYKDRSGWYFLKRDGVVVRIGQALGRLPKRTLSYFTKSAARQEKISYDPFDGHIYELALVEMPFDGIENFEQVQELLDTVEKKLIQYFDPCDNIVGKLDFEKVAQDVAAFPLDEDEDLPF